MGPIVNHESHPAILNFQTESERAQQCQTETDWTQLMYWANVMCSSCVNNYSYLHRSEMHPRFLPSCSRHDKPQILLFGDINIPHCLGCTCLSIGELVKTYLILYQVTKLPGDKWHLIYCIYWPVMNRATHDQSQQWIIQVFLILPLLQTEPISQTESKVKVWWTWVKKWWFWIFK